MKTFTTSIAIAAGLCTALSAQVRHDVAVDDIVVEVQQTPDYSASVSKNKRIDRGSWIEFEAELKTKTTHPNGYIPELKAQWYAIIQDKFHVAGGKLKPTAVMLTGQTTFKNVRAKDGTAYISAYIGPDQLEKMTGKENIQASEIIAVGLVLSGSEIAPGKHLQGAIGEFSKTAQTDKPWWNEGSIPKVEDTILAKGKTPFALLWTDRYPTEVEDK